MRQKIADEELRAKCLKLNFFNFIFIGIRQSVVAIQQISGRKAVHGPVYYSELYNKELRGRYGQLTESLLPE